MKAFADELRSIAQNDYMINASYLPAGKQLLVIADALEEATQLLKGAQTHLLDGDNSTWRRKLDAFLGSTPSGGSEHG